MGISAESGEAPRSDLLLCCVLFAWVGVGYLFPFSALTQPVDYWKKVFPNRNIEFPLVTLYMWTNLICLFIAVFCIKSEPSYTFRLVTGFIGQIIVLIAVPSFYFLHLSEDVHFSLVLIAAAVAAVVTALIDSVAISFAAQYPRRVQESLQFGIGLSTLIGSIFRLVTKAAFPADQVIASSLFYFYLGGFTVLFCVLAYFYLLTLPISKECLKFGVSASPSLLAASHSNPSVPNDDSFNLETEKTPILSKGITKYGNSANGEQKNHTLNGRTDRRSIRGPSIDLGLVSSPLSTPRRLKWSAKQNAQTDKEKEEEEEVDGQTDKWALLQKLWWPEVAVFTLFFSTLALWPPLITEIKSFDFPHLQETQWWPLLLLTVFSVSDCLGRLLTGYRFGLSSRTIHWAVLARLLLFPLLVCSVRGVLFTSDFFSVLFVLLLGFTNGYVGTISILLVNEAVDERERGLAGTFTGFFLNLGLVAGATAALFVESAVVNS